MERIRTRVELRLRSINLTPLPENDIRRHMLHVGINGIGNAFQVRVAFLRDANYLVTELDSNGELIVINVYQRLVPSWIEGMTGYHGGDATFVLDSMDQYLDQFLNEYLTANQP